ncbi:hypothetical protein [Sporosarcina highlanderae]|uniref:Uncharacterized protein n=1 Tax=Sporosarcina highlanderae TaxID=3035916 RepID=A0ABT8JPV0_9BACL|nr:hypothetical protein [Sporosarcina highlanderae]MDN4607175.1 hypothetical protein [Sporosarcina highlanderae]
MTRHSFTFDELQELEERIQKKARLELEMERELATVEETIKQKFLSDEIQPKTVNEMLRAQFETHPERRLFSPRLSCQPHEVKL